MVRRAGQQPSRRTVSGLFRRRWQDLVEAGGDRFPERSAPVVSVRLRVSNRRDLVDDNAGWPAAEAQRIRLRRQVMASCCRCAAWTLQEAKSEYQMRCVVFLAVLLGGGLVSDAVAKDWLFVTLLQKKQIVTFERHSESGRLTRLGTTDCQLELRLLILVMLLKNK